MNLEPSNSSPQNEGLLLSDYHTPADDHEIQTTEASSSAVLRRLYLSHFLSTWNSRVFEFGAVLYLASIFPGTLMPMSIYALSRGLAAVLLSPAVGQYIDTTNRLTAVKVSIVAQRGVVAASCALFWVLVRFDELQSSFQYILLTLLSLLACVEKLASVLNLVSVERDWAVVVAGNDELLLTTMNSQMRCIDLVCKLMGPFIIAVIDGFSTEVAILVNLAMNLASVVLEYYAIARVYNAVPALHRSTRTSSAPATVSLQATIKHSLSTMTTSLATYLRHPAFRASLALSLLYLTVLSFSGQMVTYLLSTGYTSFHIAAARTISVAFEISATWLAPYIISLIGAVRAGIWFLSWQTLCLTFAVAAFWPLQESSPLLSSSILIIGTILSRVGLWGFDLSAQLIVQEEVDSEARGSFSSLEASCQNTFELLSFAMTIVFARPEQFRWPVAVSCAAVASAGGLYASFVRARRGHLVHFEKLCGCDHHDIQKRRGGSRGHEVYARLEEGERRVG